MANMDSNIHNILVNTELITFAHTIANRFLQDMGGSTNMEIRSFKEHIVEGLTIEVRKYILSLDHEIKDKTIKCVCVPETWWDHFKSAWFPKWWLKRWPIKHRIIDTEIRRNEKRLCPHSTEKWGQNRNIHLQWLAELDNKDLKRDFK